MAIKIMHFSCACMPYNKGLFLQVIAPTSGWKGFIFSVIWPLSIFDFFSCLKGIWCTVTVWTEMNFSLLLMHPHSPGLQGVSKDVHGSSKIEQTLKKPFKIDKKKHVLLQSFQFYAI